MHSTSSSRTLCYICLHREPLEGFNECSPYSDESVSLEYVCDATTGETGLNSFADGTCTRVDYEGAAAPSCKEITPGAECDGSAICSSVTECTDDGEYMKKKRTSNINTFHSVVLDVRLYIPVLTIAVSYE